jgi:hypothetical protein
VPGPCPEGGDKGTKGIFAKAKDQAASLVKLVAKLPVKAATAARDKIAAKYKQAENRYGRKMAIAIIAAGVAGLPLPVPGSSLLLAAPLIAAGEAYRALSSKRDDEDPEDYTEDELMERGKKWLQEILDDWRENDVPKLEKED